MRVSLVLAALAAACSSNAEEPAGSASAGGERTATAETAASSEPEAAVGFGAAVDGRLSTLPALPVDAATPVVELALSDVAQICAYLETSVRLLEVNETCPGGSSVVIGGSCTPSGVAGLEEMLGPNCGLRLGEYIACEAAAREAPCSIDFMRVELPECAALNACLASQAS